MFGISIRVDAARAVRDKGGRKTCHVPEQRRRKGIYRQNAFQVRLAASVAAPLENEGARAVHPDRPAIEQHFIGADERHLAAIIRHRLVRGH